MLQRPKQTGFPGVHESNGRLSVACVGKRNTESPYWSHKKEKALTETIKKRNGMPSKCTPIKFLINKKIRSYSLGIAAHLLSQLGAMASFSVYKHGSGWLLSIFTGEIVNCSNVTTSMDAWKYHTRVPSIYYGKTLCCSGLFQILECHTHIQVRCHSLDMWLWASYSQVIPCV